MQEERVEKGKDRVQCPGCGTFVLFQVPTLKLCTCNKCGMKIGEIYFQRKSEAVVLE